MGDLALKFLFYPTLTTAWDIHRLLKNAKTELFEKDGVLVDEKSDLAELVVFFFKPIIKEDEEKRLKIIDEDSITRFLRITRLITLKLKELNKIYEAKMFFYRGLATLTYLISSYITWNLKLNDELKLFFGEGTFEEKAFKKLLSSILDGFWFDLAREIDAENLIYLNTISYILSLEVVLNKLGKEKREKAKEKLGFLLNLFNNMKISQVLENVLNSSINDNITKRLLPLILSSILEVSLLIQDTLLLKNEDIEEIKKIAYNEFLNILINPNNGKSNCEEYINQIYHDLIASIKSFKEGNESDAIMRMKKLGEQIVEWKLTRFNEFKLLPLQLPPEMPALAIPKIRGFEVNLTEYFNPTRLLTLTNDILGDVTNWSREIKSLLKFEVINDVEKFTNFFLKLLEESFSYVPLQYIIGFPELFLVEIAITYIIDDKISDRHTQLAKKLLQASIKILESKYDLIVELLDSHLGKIVYLQQIIGYYSYRTVYFMSQRVHSQKIREKLEKLPEGKKILEVLDAYASINERVFGKPEEIRDVSDLFT